MTSVVASDILTKTDYITVNPVLPTADFTAIPTTGPAPLVVEFSDTSTPGTSPITSWAWDFGDTVGTSTDQHPVYTYDTPGTYTVSLTVTTDVGPDTLTKPLYITVGPPIPPTADFSATPTTGPAPLDVEFTDLSDPGSAPITSWLWAFGDTQTSTEQNPIHTYGAQAVYTVSLTVTTVVDSDIETKISYIDVGAPIPPTAQFSADQTSGPLLLTVQFTDLSDPGSAPISTWLWDFGDIATSADQHPIHIYDTAGTYTVSLTVTTAVDSDTEVKTDLITVLPGIWPTAEFSALPMNGYTPMDVQFTDESEPGSAPIVDWQWDFGDTSSGTAQNPNHVYLTPGTYTVSLTVTTFVGDSTETKTDYIVAEPGIGPTANFTAGVESGTIPLLVPFTDQSNPGTSPITSWQWDFGDGYESTDANPVHTYETAGQYTVSLTVTTAVSSHTETKADYIIASVPVPVTGFVGLGILLAACFLGSLTALRRTA